MSRRTILSLSRTTQRLRVGAPAVMVLATCVTAHAAAPGGAWTASNADASDPVLQEAMPRSGSIDTARRQIARYCTYVLFAADHLHAVNAAPLVDLCSLRPAARPESEGARGLPALIQPQRSNRQTHAP